MNYEKLNIDALIKKSRHYCLDNWSYWSNKYQVERSGKSNYSNSDYDIFPRYNCLSAILDEIERVIDDEFKTIDECKETLIFIGENAESVFTEGKKNEIETKAIKDERSKFIQFISRLTKTDLENVPELFYRKLLKNKDSESIRTKLKEHWNFDGSYWEPLKRCSPKPFVFFCIDNLESNDFKNISEMIIEHSQSKMFALSEDGKDLQIESKYFESEDVYEIVYTDETYDWIFYGSHEDTIAIGGEIQLNSIKKYFKDRIELINKW